MATERVEAFLYTQRRVNEGLTSAAREEFASQGVSFQEIDLTSYRLDEEWPRPPVISSRVCFVGSFPNREILNLHVSLITESNVKPKAR